jgi:hypothetical protein
MSRTNCPDADVLAAVAQEPEMAAIEQQLDLVDYAQCEYGAEIFQMLILPALALRIPGLAAFEATV